MKLIALLTLITLSYGEKLDRTYLPPNAQASGGSDGILEGPISRPIVVSEDDGSEERIINVINEDGRTVIENVVTDSTPLQRPGSTIVDTNHQVGNDVIHIGNRGSIFIQRPDNVEYKEVHYSEPRYQIIEQRPERPQAASERHAAILRQDFKSDGESYAYNYETENGIYGEENGVATHGVQAQGGYSYIGDDGVQYSIRYTADENGFQPHGDHLPTPPPIPEEILKSLEDNARDEAAGIYDDGSYDERKYGSYDGHQELGIVNIVPNHRNVAATGSPNNVDTLVVTNSAVQPEFRRPAYLTPTVIVSQKGDLAPVVNTLVQEVTPSTVNKAYLPPVTQVVLEDRSSPNRLKPVFGTKNRQPSYNAKRGYKY